MNMRNDVVKMTEALPLALLDLRAKIATAQTHHPERLGTLYAQYCSILAQFREEKNLTIAELSALSGLSEDFLEAAESVNLEINNDNLAVAVVLVASYVLNQLVTKFFIPQAGASHFCFHDLSPFRSKSIRDAPPPNDGVGFSGRTSPKHSRSKALSSFCTSYSSLIVSVWRFWRWFLMAQGFKNFVYLRTAAYYPAGQFKLALPTIT
jgi:hypothetical protein